MRKLMAGLVALVALAGCDVLTAPFGGGGPDPYPIHIVWGTLDAEGRPSLGGRLESHAASVEAAAARWAKVIAPTPVERGSYVLEKDWEWWRAGDRIAHGITIVAMEHQCNGNPGCAGTLLVTHPDNPHVMWGGIGLHPGWGSFGIYGSTRDRTQPNREHRKHERGVQPLRCGPAGGQGVAGREA